MRTENKKIMEELKEFHQLELKLKEPKRRYKALKEKLKNLALKPGNDNYIDSETYKLDLIIRSEFRFKEALFKEEEPDAYESYKRESPKVLVCITKKEVA